MNYKIIAKYIKNLKFEIPNPKVFFSLEKDISNYKINIDIKSNQLKNQVIEIETSLFLSPISEDFEQINAKIIFSTIIEIKGQLADKKNLEEIILIKVPNEVYPEIRSIFILLFEKSGFNKIKIEEKMPLNEDCAYHLYWLKIKNRKQFMDKMNKKGIETGIHYKPIHQMKAYRNKHSLPITEKICKEIVSIPIHPNLIEKNVNYIIKTINEII